MTRNNRRGANRPRNTPLPVEVMKPQDTLTRRRVDRQLALMASSESDTVILVNRVINLALLTTPQPATFSYSFITGSDEFGSLAQQFRTFRIADVKYDIYDVNPSVPATAYWSTFHTGGGATVVPGPDDVLDRPDSVIIPPGEGKATLLWHGQTFDERGFQETGGFLDYGGLNAYVYGAATTAPQKYVVIAKAIVHFRGRF